MGWSEVKVGSLCTGYGGLDMAVEAFFDADMVWCAEIDKYASQLITTRFDKPNLGDIKQIDWDTVEPIDILTAGYPCQPFSTAGQRKGTDDQRHIWPHIIKAISILRPSIIILENVRGHLSLGFKDVLKDLAENGYDARWQIVRASDVGAPHQRARLFIIAYPKGGWSRIESSRIPQGNARLSCNSKFIANTDSDRSQISDQRRQPSESQLTSISEKEFITNSNSDARTKSRRADRKLPTTSDGLQEWQNQGQTRCECGGSCKTNCNTDNQYQSHNRQMQKLGRRFATRCEMSVQDIPHTLVEGKLNAVFVEYMMGLPIGWVTDLPLSRAQQLKMLGNGVVPQQAYHALELLCQ